MEAMRSTVQPEVLTESAVRDALRDCYHPELSFNLVDLGAVESIAVLPDADAPGAGISGVPQRYRVRVALVPPPIANEATNAQIAAIVCNRLAAFESVSGANVLLLEAPAWAPERMAPDVRARIASAASTPKHGLIQIQR